MSLEAFTFIDTNGDGMGDVGGADGNGDGTLDAYAFDINFNGVIDHYATDVNQDGFLELVIGDNNEDGTFGARFWDSNGDSVIDSSAETIEDSSKYGGPAVVGPATDPGPELTLIYEGFKGYNYPSQ